MSSAFKQLRTKLQKVREKFFEQNSCPICAHASRHFAELGGYRYQICGNCRHIFISQRYAHSFGQAFYMSNEYKEREAGWPKTERLTLFENMVLGAKAILGKDVESLLDYGAGSEDIKEKSNIAPFTTFYDPHYVNDQILTSIPEEKFEVGIATEVLEHVFDLIATLREISGLTGICLATTLLHDLNFTLSYLSPQAGHVSIFSRRSIELAAEAAGFTHQICFFPGQYQYYYHVFIAREREDLGGLSSAKPTSIILDDPL